ncbi:gamma-interferon-inducible lysosomal thiol reductase-like [Battus philenor]|uniref:gamma-interferon-inducible lysosomal thiol reductase-like n=1 Tax=Battus philenor TaxID=42288 RepID=UPI0035D12458
MKTLLVFVLAAILCGVWAKSKRDDNKVKIAVYYEALCPDSKRFVTSQLAPVWRDFRGAVKVKLVPYGKATHDKINGKWEFTCQHGPDECYGNKLQACILKDRSLQDTDKMEMVLCLMGNASPDKALDTCLDQVKKSASSDKLKRCAAGEQGDALLAAYGDKTDAVQRPLSFVPTVIINEKFDQAVQDEAVNDLRAVVCRVATTKPAAC